MKRLIQKYRSGREWENKHIHPVLQFVIVSIIIAAGIVAMNHILGGDQ
jgi:hypothetical protein